ncbi:hypothetical protein L7F22_006359 [Adiantum nelumboides]|nr:hypothetical protein [Adiantum nelumboides]
MVLTRDLVSLLFAALFTIFISLQFSYMGFSQSNQAECLALLQLAGKLNLSTNCNCAHLPSHDGLWIPCNGSCAILQPSPPWHFVGCAAEGHPVHEIHLIKMGLQGNLSWVESFKHLKLLDVSLNSFNGSIPSALWKLGELTHVNVSFNSLNGRIPDFNISNMSHIQTLDFSHNQVGGHFPHHLCTSLPNLTQLNMSSNHLTGYANLSLCQKLQSLDASLNRLQGSLFDDLMAKNSMKFINLKKNHLLNGSIPDLFGFSQLVYFDISYNKFSGILGFLHSKLPSNLSTINVSHNYLQVGFSSSTIFSIGKSSFWPNKDCRGCLVDPMTPSPLPSSSLTAHQQPPAHKRTKVRSDIIIGITAGSIAGAIFLIITVASCLIIRNRERKMIWPPHRKRPPPLPLKHTPDLGPFFFESPSGSWIADVKDPSNVPVVIFEKPLLNLTFADLIQATKSFQREFEVGDGTGLVYACVLPGVLAENAKVAIKVLEDGRSLSNEAACTAFTAMGKVKHDNLVPLLGYCIVGEEKLLIYMHMEGGSLEDVLHAMPEGVPLPESTGALMVEDWCSTESWPEEENQSCVILDSSSKLRIEWKTRHNIALGVARALAYLHNGCHQPIVHGAVSSSCILLDAGANEARLANYGGAWGLSRQLVPGYVAPESQQTAQSAALHLPFALKCRESVQVVETYSSKCDVYAMGVVLLELATGRHAVGNYDGTSTATLVAWVRRLMKGKRAERAVDPQLSASSNLPQLLEMMKVGYLCTADSASKRPSMQQVVGLLKDLGQ